MIKVQIPVDKEENISLENNIFHFLNQTHPDNTKGTGTYWYKDGLKIGLKTKLQSFS